MDIPPMGFFDLAGLRYDLTIDIGSMETQHQRVGKGPVLAAEIFDMIDGNTDLLHHLAAQRLLRRLARLDESGQGAEEPGAEIGRARQQYSLAAGDQHDDTGRELGGLPIATTAAFHRPLVRAHLGWLTAAATKTVGVVPDIQLLSHAKQAERRVIDLPQQTAQTVP